MMLKIILTHFRNILYLRLGDSIACLESYTNVPFAINVICYAAIENSTIHFTTKNDLSNYCTKCPINFRCSKEFKNLCGNKNNNSYRFRFSNIYIFFIFKKCILYATKEFFMYL